MTTLMLTSTALVLCAINYFGAYYSACAVEQIVGRERRERVL